MTTRRTFIKGIGAGLLLPSTWDLCFNFLKQRGEPLLRPPKAVSHTLYATCWAEDYQFSLDRVDTDWPSEDLTLREFAEDFLRGGWAANAHWLADDPESPAFEHSAFREWPYAHSADADAFYFLSDLDLGWFDASHETEEGYVDFVEGACPGNDSRFVTADLLGVSLLQERLNDHGCDVLIQLT